MQLKEYQQTTLNRLHEYLKALTTERDKALKATALGINYKWRVGHNIKWVPLHGADCRGCGGRPAISGTEHDWGQLGG